MATPIATINEADPHWDNEITFRPASDGVSILVECSPAYEFSKLNLEKAQAIALAKAILEFYGVK